ncbi:hypothetical protein NL676_013913 [Syzygium grande]|nr:hypothetical protein NL676_013913 [Syzygium grande]
MGTALELPIIDLSSPDRLSFAASIRQVSSSASSGGFTADRLAGVRNERPPVAVFELARGWGLTLRGGGWISSLKVGGEESGEGSGSRLHYASRLLPAPMRNSSTELTDSYRVETALVNLLSVP